MRQSLHTVVLFLWVGVFPLATSAQDRSLPPRDSPAPGVSLPVMEHTLPNGMRFLVLERRGSPTVAFLVQYPVGSVHERLGNTGIAHVLEHMLFKGTDEIGTTNSGAEAALLDEIDAVRDTLLEERARNAPDSATVQRLSAVLAVRQDSASVFVVRNEFDAILSRAGARGLNATTTYEATRYFVELPANRTELWFALEAERMRDPVFREFLPELDVVMEERRMRLETSPGALVQTALLGAAFQVHPYGVPVIGHASDLERLTRRQAREYFHKYYGAKNAVVSIVGDVDADQVVKWAEEYFSDLPSGETPPRVAAREPSQRGERRVVVEYDAEPQIAIAWKGVAGTHPDAPALTMLAAALSAGRTSPLYQRLVARDRSAIQVSAFQAPGFRDPRLFWISAVPRAPHEASEVEASIYEVIADFKASPPSEGALTRIRNQIRAGDFRRLSRNMDLASQLAESETTFGDWRSTFEMTQAILDVTAEDIQRVARTYLVDHARTVATLRKTPPS